MGLFDLFTKKKQEKITVQLCDVVNDDINDNLPENLENESIVVPEPEDKFKFKYVLIDEALLDEIIYFVAPELDNYKEGNQTKDLGVVYGIQEENTGTFFTLSKWNVVAEEPKIKTWFIMKADGVMYHVNYRRNDYYKPTEFVYEVPEQYLELAKEAFAVWLSQKGFFKFAKECKESGLFSKSLEDESNKRRWELGGYIREVNKKLMAEQKTQKAKEKPAVEKPENKNEEVNTLSFVDYAKMTLERLEKETELSYMRLETVKNVSTITDSKFGGMPYLPANDSLPVDKDGKPMRLLAQINCKDLAGLGEYPQEGILQFYLTTNPRWDESFVKYYDVVDETVTMETVANRMEGIYLSDGCFPVEDEIGLEFILLKESMSSDDNRLRALFCQYFTELSGIWLSVPDDGGEEVYELFEGYCEDSYAGGHKIGGYESSTQLPEYYPYRETDAPIDVKADDSYVLLFQMDSESEKNIMWGDLGVARFFIKRSDLKARKFENVYLVWDCS